MSFPNRYYLHSFGVSKVNGKNWHIKISMVKIKVGMEMALSPVEIIFMKKKHLLFLPLPTDRKNERRKKNNEKTKI